MFMTMFVINVHDKHDNVEGKRGKRKMIIEHGNNKLYVMVAMKAKRG